ncbi:Uncharacterised protein [Legionella steigerwaltii]|uniref:Uncharacterized protein n=2 Tax=Legionella steigerwaltii TaxID=460 RepID=A0A378L9Z7_9GAMM|nr:hypothetical protein Lstg_0027 [Legionella steigerwaltii]STY23514.1 Uncharacterised protein [Legionella steigerwaltii]
MRPLSNGDILVELGKGSLKKNKNPSEITSSDQRAIVMQHIDDSGSHVMAYNNRRIYHSSSGQNQEGVRSHELIKDMSTRGVLGTTAVFHCSHPKVSINLAKALQRWDPTADPTVYAQLKQKTAEYRAQMELNDLIALFNNTRDFLMDINTTEDKQFAIHAISGNIKRIKEQYEDILKRANLDKKAFDPINNSIRALLNQEKQIMLLLDAVNQGKAELPKIELPPFLDQLEIHKVKLPTPYATLSDDRRQTDYERIKKQKEVAKEESAKAKEPPIKTDSTSAMMFIMEEETDKQHLLDDDELEAVEKLSEQHELYRAFRSFMRNQENVPLSKSKGVSCNQFIGFSLKVAIIDTLFNGDIPKELMQKYKEIEAYKASKHLSKLNQVPEQLFKEFQTLFDKITQDSKYEKERKLIQYLGIGVKGSMVRELCESAFNEQDWDTEYLIIVQKKDGSQKPYVLSFQEAQELYNALSKDKPESESQIKLPAIISEDNLTPSLKKQLDALESKDFLETKEDSRKTLTSPSSIKM